MSLLILACLIALGACEGRSSAPLARRSANSRRKIALDTRGGSSLKQKRNKKVTSERESLPPADPPCLPGDASNQDRPNKLPRVEALLVPRRFNLRKLIQAICFAALFVSFGACVATSGSPHGAAVFQLVYQTGPAPPNYQPTRTELFLAQKLAAVSKDILPPLFLPSAVPLLSLLGAVAVWLACCILCPQWFIDWNILLNYKKYPIGKRNAQTMLKKQISNHSNYSNHYQAAVLVSIPRESRVTEGNGKPKLVLPLRLSEETGNLFNVSHEAPYYFDLNHRRMYTDLQTSSSIDGGPKGHLTKSLKDLTCTRTIGFRTRTQLQSAQVRYGPYASMSLPEPTLAKALQARLISPLSVLQLVGKLLQALEESMATSLFGIATTIGQHWFNARQAIVSAKELAQEVQGSLQDVGSQKVWALRPGGSDGMEWAEISSVELLPGDLFLLATADMTMPVDALLLDGTVVTNEAALTGESVPQAKMPLEEIDSQPLDMMGRHRGSVLFAGTTVLFHNNDQQRKVKGFPKVPKKARKGVQCLALRTGSYSSRGDLMRALSKSRVGAISNPESERDALKLILSLSVFAVIACWTSLSSDKHETSTFRRIIQCTRIGIASIPSNIPMALSAIAQSCAAQLRRDSDVVCSEPGALLTAATIDAVVFDKTGTLTADTQSLSAIVPPESCRTNIEWMVDAILGGCHSLITLKDKKSENKLIGDPLDLASLRYSGWIYSQKEDCYTKTAGNYKGTKLWQIKTFPFDPTRRTSSAILLVTDPLDNMRIMKVIKGSPDMIEHLVDHDKHNQTWYRAKNSQLGKEGMRTIALASKELAVEDHMIKILFPDGVPSSNAEIALAIKSSRRRAQNVYRDDVEKVGFDFAGFACFIASIRPSTKRIIDELLQAGIPVTMLTGDSIEAAITTSRAAGLIKAAATAVLDVDGGRFIWKIEDNDVVKSRHVTQSNWSKFRSLSNRNLLSLISTGNAVELLQSTSKVSSLLASIKSDLSTFAIIARASPKQKEYAISSMKNDGGKKVLMCGKSYQCHDL
jgi:magnesium-transporting ATPase (P-type)